VNANVMLWFINKNKKNLNERVNGVDRFGLVCVCVYFIKVTNPTTSRTTKITLKKLNICLWQLKIDKRITQTQYSIRLIKKAKISGTRVAKKEKKRNCYKFEFN
jgi:hypothetical protein